MNKDILLDKSRSDDIFIVINNKSYSFIEFNALVSRFIKMIEDSNLKIQRLGINCNSKLNILVAVIACNRLNITPAIIPPKHKGLSNINYEKIASCDAIVDEFNCIIQLNGGELSESKSIENNIQCILFTSGSKGAPKAVELTFDNIFSSALNWNKALRFKANSRYLNILPLYHIGGLVIFFRSIYCNFVSVVCDYNKHNILSEIIEKNIDYISVVPKMLYDFINRKELNIVGKNIDTIVIGGDGINKYHYDELVKNNVNAYVSYGMTETSSGISGYFINQIENFDPGFLGYAHNNVDITVANNNIVIQSKTVMNRYVGDKHCNGLFITDDAGHIKNGKKYFLSRGVDSIISGGVNISLSSIRNIINTCPGIIDNVVIGSSHDKWGEIPVVLFEGDADEINIDKLNIFCKKNLPRHMMPKQYISINKIPYKNSKIDYELIYYYAKKSMV